MDIPRKRIIRMRYKGAISDADILINFAKVKSLDVLELLFKEIIISQFVYDIEIKKNAGKYYSVVNQAIYKDGGIFRVIDRKKDNSLNLLAKSIIEEKRKVIGLGESECAGYAQALRIPIIISDNYTEFKWLNEFITLTHNNILALCVYFEEMTKSEAENIFNKINNQLKNPTKDTFNDQYIKAMRRFGRNEWERFLGITKKTLHF
jgi:predicted nucleic acid-binding protein